MKKFFTAICLLFFVSTSTWGAEIKLSLSKQTLRLGEVSKVIVHTKSPISSYTLSFAGKKFTLFLDEKENGAYRYVSYIAAKRTLDPGTKILKVKIKCQDKSSFYEHYKMKLRYPKKRKQGNVKLTKKAKKKASKKSAYKEEGRLLTKLFNTKTKKQFFKGAFKRPTTGRMSSGFAKLRRYNNGSTSSHAGVDFANKIGTPVVAPEGGKIIFSDYLEIHGNTIVLDHGFGVLSVFCHLDKRIVKKNQWVRKGWDIGTIGKTGVVSGAHLHWGLSVQNVRVDPLFWLSDDAAFLK